MGPVFKVLEVGDSMAPVDAQAPADSTVSALGIEREALRGGWLAITVSSLNPAGESWAGVYATYFPGSWRVVPGESGAMGVLALGR